MKKLRVLLIPLLVLSIVVPGQAAAQPAATLATATVKLGKPCADRGEVAQLGARWLECNGTWKRITANTICLTKHQDAGTYSCDKRSGALRWTVVPARKWAACDPDDPRIAEAGIVLPTGAQPEARIAAACVALEWLANPAPDPAIVEIVRSPLVHEAQEASNLAGLLAMERLIGRRFVPAGTPLKLLLIGQAMEWGCTYGRKEIDPLIPARMPASWTEQWLGCKQKQWPCGGSNIELTDGTRFMFSACKGMDMSVPPNATQNNLNLCVGHELVHILQYQLSQRFVTGQPPGYDWAEEGVPIYFNMAAAWLAGYEGNWRLLEDRTPYQVWRSANPTAALSISLVSNMNIEVVPGCPGGCSDNPQVRLKWLLGSLAVEYLIAHWGIDAPFKFYKVAASGGLSFSERAFGLSKKALYASIDEYLRHELEE